MKQSDEFWFVSIAMLAAILLAAHQLGQNAAFGLFSNYLYWFGRVLIEAGIFIATLYAIEKYLKRSQADTLVSTLAIATSLVPFTLAITAFDLIVGLPELGFNGSAVGEAATVGKSIGGGSSSRLKVFTMELVYQVDNHIALCVLMLMPRFILKQSAVAPAAPAPVQSPASAEQGAFEPDDVKLVQGSTSALAPAVPFFDALDPPLPGNICSIEAQEHYIRVTTMQESRMILYRFSDAIRQISATEGMQVHRSYWVAHASVLHVMHQGQNVKLKLSCNKVVPVSRTFRSAVESRYASRSSASELSG